MEYIYILFRYATKATYLNLHIGKPLIAWFSMSCSIVLLLVCTSRAYIRCELLVKMVYGLVRGQVVLLITVDLKAKSENLRLPR